MPYTAPSTKTAYTTLTATEWNVIVNDIIDLNQRVLRGTYAARPVSPAIGDFYYQTDTEELLKYVTDFDGQNRWMQTDHDYRRNFVINGGFDIWQRGFGFNPASATSTTRANYGADRWQFLQATTSPSAFNAQSMPSSDIAGYQFYLRVWRTSGLTLTTPYTIQTSFETSNIPSIRNKYLTLSFWARAGATYSATSSNLVSNIVTGTGTDGTVGNFTTNTVNTTANNVLTTTWKRFSITTTAPIGTTISQLGIQFVFTPTTTALASDYYDITGVQLEVGTAPSDFEFRDVGEELRRCQRYYYRLGPYAANWQPFSQGTCIISGTTIQTWNTFPVTMRSVPTSVEKTTTASDYAVFNSVGVQQACSAIPAFVLATVDGAKTTWTNTANGLNTGMAGVASNNGNTNAYLGWSAEL
jgi:hypothetical protein